MKLKLVTLAALGVGVVLASACSSDEEGDGAQTSGTGGKGGSGGSLSGGRGGTTSLTGGTGGTGGGSAGCTSLALPCDGPEDCPTGNMCCGHFGMSAGGYVEFQCLPSCTNATFDGGGQDLWLELCHAGQACEDPTFTCSTSPTYLPPWLSRCYDSGGDAGTSGSTAASEINCGNSVCTSEQQCCLVTPGESFCTAKGAACGCTPSTPDAGGDAGTDASATAGAGGVSGASGASGAAGRRGGGRP
jgi:hypothetical protein